MKTIPVFRKALGLNNVSDPTRLKYDFESGATELAVAYNVDIDSSGRIAMRRGLTATSRTESSHSIFCDGGECLFICGTSLYRLNPDYSRTGVRSGMTAGNKCRYVQIAGRIYYSNQVEIGYVLNGVSYVWQAETYIGPTTHRRFSNPVVGKFLEFLSSRIYVSKDNILWYSEPFAYGWFDLASNFVPFGSIIRMVRSVKTGLYVGTEREVVFIGGAEPKQFTYEIVSNSPVVEGTDVKLSGAWFEDGKVTGQLAMWTAQDGIYVGMPDGQVRNITKEKIVYPGAFEGCAVIKNNKYVSLLK